MTIIFKIIFIYILKKILFVEATPYYGQKQWNLSNTKGRYNDFNHDEEMVHLSTTPSTNYTINAFGRTIHLSLKPNTLLMPFKTQIVDENKSYDLPYLEKPCHYLHRSKRGLKPEGITAAISFCQPNIVTGLIITEDITFEISPLPQNENYPSHQIYDLLAMANAVYENNNAKEYIPHLIKKASLPPNFSLFEDNIYNT
ncbi:uncharacterized protein LOC142321225 [Lycorma delicatula]|uniref:uncharacterized protein LOC142321225 n=1 Tax=Lycorma delicatula TaxID=130591 RepID=UPI003F5140F4